MNRNDYGFPIFDAPLLDAGIDDRREIEISLWAITGWALAFTLAVLLVVAGYAWRDERSQRVEFQRELQLVPAAMLDPCSQPVQVKQ